MKIKLNNTLLLVCCALLLTMLCIISVGSPISFDHQLAERENAVKTRLIKIRVAEEKYRAKNGTYTGSFDNLVKSGLLADSLRYIPFTDKKQFSLQATSMTGKSGQQIPLMECGATYDQYLQGLDKNSVNNMEEEANSSGRYPGLKIGDLETPNNNAGNWE